MNLLHTIGLMTRAERNIKPAKARTAETLEQHIMDVNIAKSDAEWWARERIATLQVELAAQTEEHERVIGNLKQIIGKQSEEIADLRPDALAMRKKRAADRKRMAGKRGKA